MQVTLSELFYFSGSTPIAGKWRFKKNFFIYNYLQAVLSYLHIVVSMTIMFNIQNFSSYTYREWLMIPEKKCFIYPKKKALVVKGCLLP